MDGRLDSVINSIGLSMAMNDSYVVDCVLNPHDWDQFLQGIHMLFENDDSLPDVAFIRETQVVLDNGSEINKIGNGRGMRGRRPHIIVFDEIVGEDMRIEAITTGAPLLTV